MSEREAAVANGAAREVISHEGREVVLVSEVGRSLKLNGTLSLKPTMKIRSRCCGTKLWASITQGCT